nr:immunoglobulin heavy chain junction region [Macaca mulatta]MOW46137.1 immunoglobulin heavy chain junction region [Macaca mulatta]MOW46395.1 immunoglobulin heavy chain junction region [Macaca mulatta]MOW47520.1 immunoglobulin heavy chain junction region [Macaca mulatta]MOW47528.1 immunoglobulin heavy chain junction region [Macaca mulatta]
CAREPSDVDTPGTVFSFDYW